MQAPELCNFLGETFHAKIRASLNILQQNIEEWLFEFTNGQVIKREELQNKCSSLIQELEKHLRKKETIFYPYVLLYEDWKLNSEQKPNLAKGSIDMMVKEQNKILDLLNQIMQITRMVNLNECKNKVCLLCVTEILDLNKMLNKLFTIEQSILFPKLFAA
jgi:iron-sulfur cluster repair protein YtfE (RIC family)